MQTRKSFQEKILSNFAYTGTNKACQGKLVTEHLLVCTGAQALNDYPAYDVINMWRMHSAICP